jgi:hypothetical protein
MNFIGVERRPDSPVRHKQYMRKQRSRQARYARNPKFEIRNSKQIPNPKLKREEEHENAKERKIEKGFSFSAFPDFAFS